MEISALKISQKVPLGSIKPWGVEGRNQLWAGRRLGCLVVLVEVWPLEALKLGWRFTIVSSQSLDEGCMNLHEETLQLRPFLRELIAKACILASLHIWGKKNPSVVKEDQGGTSQFPLYLFCQGWRFLNGLGDGLEFPGNEELQSRVVRKLKNSREEKLVWIGSAR